MIADERGSSTPPGIHAYRTGECPSTTAEPLELGARALYGEGDLRTARRHFEAAYERAERTGDAEGMAAAAVGLGGLWVHEHRGSAPAAEVQSRQRRALFAVRPSSPWALELRLRLAAESDYRLGRHDAMLGLLDEARRIGDDTALATALNLTHHCLLGPEHAELRGRLSQELVLASAGSDRTSDRTMALLWRTVDRFLVADPHAERSLAELTTALTARPNQAVAFVVRAIRVMQAIRAGRLSAAELMAVECAELGRACGDLDADGWFGAQMIAVRWYQGRIAEALPLVQSQAHSPALSELDSATFAGLAVAAAGAGDQRAAAGALARLGGGDPARLPSSSTLLASLFGAVEAADLLGDAATAARLYDLLMPHRRLPVMVSLAVVCFGSTEHALGVASLTTGDLDRAVDHLTHAVRRNLALEHWPAVVHSRRRLGEALGARGAPGDAERAGHEFALAAREAADLGMPPEPMPRPRRLGAGPGRRPDDGARARDGGAARSAGATRATSPAFAVRATGTAPTTIVLRRRGRQWRLEFGAQIAIVEHTVGMLYLAQLLASPGREIPAVELAAGRAGEGAGVDAPTAAHPVLDQVARREFRDRLARVEAEIVAAGGRPDTARLTALRAERDWLAGELAAGTGLGGRPREFADNAERARIAVGKAIRRALDRVSAAHPELGDQLRSSIRTGFRCCYQPEVTATLGHPPTRPTPP